jgi:hypothetical protein
MNALRVSLINGERQVVLLALAAVIHPLRSVHSNHPPSVLKNLKPKPFTSRVPASAITARDAGT